MATLRTLLVISLATAAILAPFAAASTYTVGGSNGGWDTSTNLQSWGTAQTFSVGDTLVFQYSPNHDVTEVSKPEYDSCQATNPIQTNTGGSTTITLNSPGKRYFICTTPGHCTSGMKLQVDTLAASSSSSPSNSPETSPSPAPADAPTHSFAPVSSKKASAPSPSLVKAAAEGPGSGASDMTSPVISIATGLVLGLMILLSA
ncbi:hypothetical protein MLD38_003060 [Melastoma candidum]|uniref:Uncharacterized protein n=1 Tax=Melastoma candidum TaxID=119954 RepID=A0ACB9S2Y1_9MYRT|nr:hypothetical protein MLD38_003060 [Melastoma candidum]